MSDENKLAGDDFYGTPPGLDPRDPLLIPPLILRSIENHVQHGVPAGSFLEAVLCNDLTTACARADVFSMRGLVAIVAYLYNYAPRECWGSEERYRAWLEAKASERAAAP